MPVRLTLSPSELDRLTNLVEALHAPFDYADVDAWRHAVNHYARLLLDAHKIVFKLPGVGHAPVYSQRLDPGGAHAYLEYFHRFDVAGALALEHSLPVASLLEIHGRDEFYASEYYNDFMKVWDCNHSVGMVTPIDAAPGYAYLAMLRDKYEDPPFDRRERTLLRFVLPAFRAGVQTYLRLAADRAVLGAVLDASEKRLLLCDDKGRPVHASAALERTLAADPERPAIERNMHRLARVTAELRGNGKNAVRSLAKSGERVLATMRGRYRLCATLAGESGPSPAGVLVLLEPLFRETLPNGELRERFGLTGQEIRVARRIAEGAHNDEVAQDLAISPHTARRHTERVLAKLGVVSRAQVAERISRS
ncbi:MAG TPA: LuxR C-terminal-related transcriptional regulator [Gemmatimonadota bacterium]|nr:LuxR C-terminal-related transcriptional regulator [Gemmatimonadota bacterium]